MGIKPQEIIAEIPHLSLAQVQAALAYYYVGKEEIDADIAAGEAECDRLANEHKARN